MTNEEKQDQRIAEAKAYLEQHLEMWRGLNGESHLAQPALDAINILESRLSEKLD